MYYFGKIMISLMGTLSRRKYLPRTKSGEKNVFLKKPGRNKEK
jgi:hypothetical protein